MWFSVSFLYRSEHTPDDDKEPRWLESIRLIDALSEEDAEAQAKQIARSDEHSYEVDSGVTVTWIFMSIERVFQIDSTSLASGTEVFSRFLRSSEAESLLRPFDDD